MDEPAKDKTVKALATPATDEMTNVQDRNLIPLNFCDALNFKPNVKFTLAKARTVDNHTLTDEDLTSSYQIPDYILKTLMIVNYHAREFELKQLTSDKDRNKTKDNSSDESEDEDESEDSDLDENDNRDVGVNPMDALLWLFYHSDTFLRRALAIKLSACQLSVPFLLPDPADSKHVTILLSTLENITKCWKGASPDNESAQEVFATEYPFPVVSFIRIGKITMSKSSLINKIMSDGNCDHDFFFHKNIQGGHAKRKVVDGLVELSWYLPEGSEKQILQNEICFANLRGEARLFEKQVDVLLKISSVLCVLLPSDNPDENITKMLKEVMQSKAKVILIFNEKKQENTKKYFNNLKKKSDTKLSMITKAKERNEYCFFQSIRENIQKNIHEVKPTPLVELVSSANHDDIRLDDDEQNFRLRKNVDDWLELEAKEVKNLLKLQMHIPVLSYLEREKYRLEGSKSETGCFKRDADEIYKNIKAEREAQRGSFAQMDERVCDYLNSIASMDETERRYSLSKVKHQLDKISLQTMTKLHQEYRVASLNLQKKEKETRLKSNIRLSEDEYLKHFEKSISQCSFGLEHIIRELAQLYQLGVSTIDYAGAAAEMLLSGLPLELLDGDSSYIPLQWFNAVYRELERKTNNAKIFVISVLGIQSSGKSTMLNTMFGLEFPVSADRCTRGAFASLIPVSDSLKSESKFDYILIIDTEGLRGSGDSQLRKHDNELAIFTIGVADVTIVNIFGENHNEMKEFLEVAVHAFLKMKLVKEKKTCKIVHQNVVATDATDKLFVARRNLKQDLDKMARVAAIEENCEEEFQKLNDIVLFDENEDVFYIPSFLIGSPPMAPVNPHYGRAVQRLKENIITLMCAKDRFRLSVFQFREKVHALWKSMLKENFIFSFRNTIEVRAYTSLDRKYFEESIKLIVVGMAKLEKKIQATLSRCSTRDEREDKWTASKKQIRKEAEKLREEMETKMKDFFETSEDKATLEQWKENVMNRIEQLKENHLKTVTKNCFASFNYWQNRQDIEEQKQNYEKELLKKAKTFVTSAHTDDVEKCKAVFDQEWQQWIVDVPPCQESKIDVNSEMVDVLFGNANRILNAEMAEKLKGKDDLILNFKEIDLVIDLDQLTISYLNKFLNKVENERDVLMSANRIKDKVVATALEFAEMTSNSGVRCTHNDLEQMYHKVITTIDKETEKCRFKFSKRLKCDILLYTFAYAFPIFDKMEERYIRERDIKGELERNLRPRLENFFLNVCREMKKEVLSATLIVDVLQEPMESELNRTMGSAVTTELLTIAKYQSKGQFHASVLIQLGEEKNFQSYIPYLKNPVIFLRDKLMESIENYCLKEKPASIALLLEKEAKKMKDAVFTAISTASKETKTGSKTLNFWIQQFVENCSVLGITKEMFALAAIDDDLKEIDVFETKVRANVTEFLDSLMKHGVDRDTFLKWSPSPHDYLYTSMFGCQKCCPFCKGLCDQSAQNHACSHSTRIHRPLALTGHKTIKTERLFTEICTTAVARDSLFRNSDTSGKPHVYKNYQSVNSYYKSWKIPRDSSFETSVYWQWFMATFSKELAEYYKAKEPEIPSVWQSRTFANAKDQLRQEYNL